jgi:hypothetical protein
MSFASSFAAAPRFLSGAILKGTLAATGRTVGIVVCAGMLAAIYQAASDETRSLLNSLRARNRFRQARHEAVLLRTLGTTLSPPIQEALLRSRNAFKQSLALLADPDVPTEQKATLRQALETAYSLREG